MIEQLRDGEEFFIWVNRSFNFLGGYRPIDMELNSRDQVIYVTLYSYLMKKRITVAEDEKGDLDFWVETKT